MNTTGPSSCLSFRAFFLGLIALLAMGCAKESTPTPVPQATVLAEGDIAAMVAFVDSWTAAQNSGDFGAYQALYDPSFSGIKRAGDRVSNYDYKGWLRDRRSMFAQLVHVETFDPRFTPYQGQVLVEFTQNWSSGDFRDTGRKVMTLAKTATGYRIFREEMLNSRLLPPNAALDPTVAAVRVVHAARYLVLDTGAVGAPVGSEPLFVDRLGNAELIPPPSAIPEKYRALVGQRFVVFDSQGKKTGVTIESIVVLGACVPHFGTLQRWASEEEGVVTEESVAQETIDMAALFWAARLDAEVPEARFALPADATDPDWFTRAELTSESTQALKAAFRLTDSWRTLENYYAESAEPGDPVWPTDQDERYAAYENSNALRVALSNAGFSINHNSMQQTTFWSEDNDKFTPLCNLSLFVSDEKLPDFNHNGIPDLVAFSYFGDRSLIVDGEYLWSLSIPYYDCPF